MIDTLVAGTTGPPITVTFTRAGAIVPLTGVTVTATISRGTLDTLTKTLTVLDPATAGQAQLAWADGDLALPDGITQAQWFVDFDLTFAGWSEKQPHPALIAVRAPLT